ncbi:hypothetical protein M422DRAFT_45150 [Sphaerobolus stellatus SS14]|nr:hypothetical protein M422DRAFT_45150 [Sphaerobolus stellatus SS14]
MSLTPPAFERFSKFIGATAKDLDTMQHSGLCAVIPAASARFSEYERSAELMAHAKKYVPSMSYQPTSSFASSTSTIRPLVTAQSPSTSQSLSFNDYRVQLGLPPLPGIPDIKSSIFSADPSHMGKSSSQGAHLNASPSPSPVYNNSIPESTKPPSQSTPNPASSQRYKDPSVKRTQSQPIITTICGDKFALGNSLNSLNDPLPSSSSTGIRNPKHSAFKTVGGFEGSVSLAQPEDMAMSISPSPTGHIAVDPQISGTIPFEKTKDPRLNRSIVGSIIQPTSTAHVAESSSIVRTNNNTQTTTALSKTSLDSQNPPGTIQKEITTSMTLYNSSNRLMTSALNPQARPTATDSNSSTPRIKQYSLVKSPSLKVKSSSRNISLSLSPKTLLSLSTLTASNRDPPLNPVTVTPFQAHRISDKDPMVPSGSNSNSSHPNALGLEINSNMEVEPQSQATSQPQKRSSVEDDSSSGPPTKKLKLMTESSDISSTSKTRITGETTGEDQATAGRFEHFESQLLEMRKKFTDFESVLKMKEDELECCKHQLEAEKAAVIALRTSLDAERQKRHAAEALEKMLRSELHEPFIVPSLLDAFIALSKAVGTIEVDGDE